MRVLLIEDDSATAQSIELMLQSEGFNVYTTDLGEGRIGIVVGVRDACALLLDGDLAVEVLRHLAEITDHHLDLGNLALLLFNLEAL